MISFFGKRTFFNINSNEEYDKRTKPIKGGYLMRVSSMIRIDQIAEAIGARVNPISGYEDDVCIYIKPMVKKGYDFKFEGKPYIDIIDGHNLGQLAQKHPEVTVIVCSQADYNVMSKAIPNKIVLIPQHHINFDRLKRTRTEIKTVGTIGTRDAFPYLPKELRGELSKRGIELVEFSRFFKRQDIIDFYLKIDLQIVWRPYKKILSNPLKIINAASFGIPTIALEEKVFKEVDGCYIPVNTFPEFLECLDALISSPEMYKSYSLEGIENTERYHISNIIKLYKELV